MGINFVTYLNMIRVEHAATELKISGNRVWISLFLPLQQYRTFSRYSKKKSGYTPENDSQPG